jgi:ABC-type nitrate/sulfonate/bicarbonate transport system substrate-binding protein
MKQGLTAATMGTPPSDFLGKKLGFVVLARSHELFSWPVGGLLATVKKIKEKPDETKRVIKAGIKANRYIRQNREGTIQFMMGWMKIDKEMATATYESSWKSITRMEAYPKMDSASSLKRQKRPSRLTVKSHSTKLWISRFSEKRSGSWGLSNFEFLIEAKLTPELLADGD